MAAIPVLPQYNDSVRVRICFFAASLSRAVGEVARQLCLVLCKQWEPHGGLPTSIKVTGASLCFSLSWFFLLSL